MLPNISQCTGLAPTTERYAVQDGNRAGSGPVNAYAYGNCRSSAAGHLGVRSAAGQAEARARKDGGGGGNTCARVRKHKGAGCTFRSSQQSGVGAPRPGRVEVP